MPSSKKTSRRTERQATASRMAHRMAHRMDGWMSTLTGLGTSRDKRMSATSQRTALAYFDLVELYRGDWLAARIVDAPVDEMLREGLEVIIQEEEQPDGKRRSPTGAADFSMDPSARRDLAGEPRDAGKELADAANQWFRDFQVRAQFSYAEKFARAYGGCGIFVGADDGAKDLREPLREDRIRSIDCLNVFDARELISVSYYTNPLAAKYGETEVYRIQPQLVQLAGSDYLGRPGEDVFARKGRRARGGREMSFSGVNVYMPEVHESRVLRFDGTHVNRRMRRENLGWGDSALVRVFETIRDFGMSWQSAALLIQDFSQAVVKMEGLLEMLSDEDDDALMKRLVAMDMGRSVARALLLDSKEDFERKPTTVAGLADLLEKLMLGVAGAANMPVMVLMGQTPSGLNADGKGSLTWWYDRIDSLREIRIGDNARRLARLMFLSEDGPSGGRLPDKWDIRFGELMQLSELEQAQLRKTQAETDKIYVDDGVLDPAEVTQSRFGGEKYSTETVIDKALRGRVAKAQKERDAAALAAPGAEPGATAPFGGGEQGTVGAGEGVTTPPAAVVSTAGVATDSADATCAAAVKYDEDTPVGEEETCGKPAATEVGVEGVSFPLCAQHAAQLERER